MQTSIRGTAFMTVAQHSVHSSSSALLLVRPNGGIHPVKPEETRCVTLSAPILLRHPL
jgi:hypothetical protein